MSTAKVRLTDIVELPHINIRQFVREEAVERYAEILDQLPPISLTRLDDNRLVLTDGKHRMTAAERLGRNSIGAEITDGTIQDAIVAAATANAKHGVPFNRDEQRAAILHLWQSDTAKTNKRRWTYAAIAEAVGSTRSKVEQLCEAQIIRESPTTRDVMGSLNDGQVVAIGRAPEAMRPQLAEAAAEHGWTVAQTREAAKALADPGVAEETKRRVLAEVSTPGDNGEATIPADLISAMLKESRGFSARPQIRAFIGAAHSLLDHLKRDTEPLAGMSPADLHRLFLDIDAAQQAVDKLRHLVAGEAVPA